MSLLKATRKIKRVGKTAVQFRITSTFEFIELQCKGTWRPENLRVIWLRNHRKVKSNDTTWTVSEDFGPNGAKGRAVFNPAISVSLVVTLYRDAQQTEFDEKEYKYHVEHEGAGGKKILATFNCNVAEFVGIPTTRHALDLNFKCVSKKVSEVKLGITLETQFVKEGGALDDDMQSTFSAMSAGQDSVAFDEEDDDFEEGGGESNGGGGGVPTTVHSSPSQSGNRRRLNTLQEESEHEIDPTMSVVLGTGEHLKRGTIPRFPPPKPPHSSNYPDEPSDSNSLSESQAEDEGVASVSNGVDVDTGTRTASPPPSTAPASNGSSNTDRPSPDTDQVLAVNDNTDQVLAVNDNTDQVLAVNDNTDQVLNGSSNIDLVPPPTIVISSCVTEQEVGVAGSNGGVSKEEGEMTVADSGESASESRPREQVPESNGAVEGAGLKSKVEEVEMRPKEAVKEEAENGTPATCGEQKLQNGGSEPDMPNKETSDGVISSNGVDAYGREIDGRGYDHVFEMARSLATISNGTQGASTASGSPKTVESNDTHVAPPNPVEADGVEVDIMVTKPSPTETWLDQEARLVDCFNDTVSREKLEQADIIGLYFSAGWCPPCRRFLPKLVKFYHHLKQHSKSFEIVYVSSDYSEQDMMKYMKEQQMPWVGIAYEGNISEDFRKSFNISAVPLLKILTRKGYSVEDSAKKSVESASSGSAILKLYNKWHEKMVSESTEEEGRITATGKEKKGLLSKVKATIGSKEKQRPQDSEQIVSELQTHDSSPPRSPEHEAGRRVVDTRQTRTKSKVGKGALTQELLDEKDERIHHLEEVNRTLKQTNDEQAEELGELRAKLQLLTTELNQLKSTSKTLQEESKELIANLNMRGWLFKRGVRGPTANIWRRRYFRLDQGSKLYYYKNSSEGNPQGYIDMDKVLTVQEVTPSQQDKNHSTFTVQCDGRTFQLQAHDEPSMRKWMEAILYMVSWRKKNSRAIAEDLA